MKLRVILAGATGWAGSAIVKTLINSTEFELVAAISPRYAGKDLSEILQVSNYSLIIDKDVNAAVKKTADIFIDYTHPDAVKNNVLTAIAHGLHVIVGTSGMTNEDYQEIDKAAQQKKVGVIAAGNFSITAVLMQRFAVQAAKYIPHWEIIDYAHAGKPDAPSGTVRQLAYELSKVRKPEFEISVAQTKGLKEARGGELNGSQIHSLRLPGFTLGADVIFGLPDEKLIIKHEAGSSAAPYVGGTLLAAKYVAKFTGLIRGLDTILE